MFLGERMMEDFVQESEILPFLTALLLSVHRRRGNFRHIRRKAWAWPRPQNWFYVMLASPRMNVLGHQTFEWNVKRLTSFAKFLLRKPVSVEKRVAVGVWRLSTGNSYWSCGLQFGLGKSTAKVICQEFEEALCRKEELFIWFPYSEDEVQEAMDTFEEEYKFPQIVGAIDGCHMEINAPPENKEDYFNRKQYYSINLQGTVNSRLLFQHVAVGYPGRIHDARVLDWVEFLTLQKTKKFCQHLQEWFMGDCWGQC